MTKIGIIRCEKNAEKCPLTNCLKTLRDTKEGFAGYEHAELVGIFTCRCPGDLHRRFSGNRFALPGAAESLVPPASAAAGAGRRVAAFFSAAAGVARHGVRGAHGIGCGGKNSDQIPAVAIFALDAFVASNPHQILENLAAGLTAVFVNRHPILTIVHP